MSRGERRRAMTQLKSTTSTTVPKTHERDEKAAGEKVSAGNISLKFDYFAI